MHPRAVLASLAAALLFVGGCVCVQHAISKPERRAVSCDTRLDPGDHLCRVDNGLVVRTFLLHVPPGLPPAGAAPLVLAFHGFGSTSEQMAWISKLSDKADAEKFLVVILGAAFGSAKLGEAREARASAHASVSFFMPL